MVLYHSAMTREWVDEFDNVVEKTAFRLKVEQVNLVNLNFLLQLSDVNCPIRC